MAGVDCSAHKWAISKFQAKILLQKRWGYTFAISKFKLLPPRHLITFENPFPALKGQFLVLFVECMSGAVWVRPYHCELCC